MSNNNSQYNLSENKIDDSHELINFDIKAILNSLYKYKYLFVAFVLIAITSAYIYLRYTVPVYKSSMTIMIKDESGGQEYSKEMIFKELGFESAPKKIQNELQILKSRPLMEKVVKNLGLQVKYSSVGRVRDFDLYKNIISVTNFTFLKEGYGKDFIIEIMDEKQYKISDGTFTQLGEFDSLTICKYGSLKLKLNKSAVELLPYSVKINLIPIAKAVRIYNSSLMATSKIELGNILELSIEDVSSERANDVLNSLVEIYNQDAIDDNNQMARNTLKFIDERLELITQELSGVELNFENFRQKNRILGDPEEVKQLLTKISTQDEELSKTQIQVSILDGIENYLKKEENKFEFVPTNLNLNNLTLIPLLQAFNDLLSQRNRLARVVNIANPQLQELNEEIENTRGRILESITNIRTDLKITLESFQKTDNILNQQISAVPHKEREFLEIKRQQNIKENLYLFLLQKREETALSQAMTIDNARVVNPPLASEYPIRPRRGQIYILTLLLGFLVPALLIYLTELLRDTVESEKDIAKLTNTPFLGGIGLSRGKTNSIAVTDKSRTSVAESFRALRTNLQFLAAGEKNQVLLVTSSSSGEGKTFISLNLGMTYAIAQKKVIIVVMDLRKPKLLKYLKNVSETEGMSNYLAGHLEISRIIQKTDVHPNLFVIGSGPVPPNPAELMMNNRVENLFTYLRENFDIIIVDTPPVGLVADALLLNDYIDSSLYIVRHNVTQKGQMRIVEDLYKQNKFRKLGVVMNGIQNKGRYGSSYTYGYGYGYGYGYFEDTPLSWINNLTKKIKYKKRK